MLIDLILSLLVRRVQV